MLSFGFTACDDDLDVTQAYPFTVETMPVPKELAQGETAEIRCELVREGEFDGAVYTIRYFQFDGEGTLKLDNGLVFLPNDRYLLENEKFRLYYTSECDESQSLTITVEDNFGNAFEWEVEFNNGSDADVAVSDTFERQPMMRKALLLLLAAALCGSLPAQDTEETARLLALFNSHPKSGHSHRTGEKIRRTT